MAVEQDWSRLNDDQFMEQMLGEKLDDLNNPKSQPPKPAQAPAPAAEAIQRAARDTNPAAPLVKPAAPAQLGLPGLGGGAAWERPSMVPPGAAVPNFAVQAPAAKPGAGDIDLLAKKDAAKPTSYAEKAWNLVKEFGSDMAQAGHDVVTDPAAFGRSIIAAIPKSAALTGRGFEAFNEIGQRTGASQKALDATNPVLGFLNRLTGNGVTKAIGTALHSADEGMQKTADAIGPSKDRQNTATMIGDGIGQITGLVASSILTGGATDLPLLLGQGAGQMADKVKEDGKQGTWQGDLATIAGAPITALSEKLPLEAIVHGVPNNIKNKVLSKLTDVAANAGLEGLSEVAEGVMQNLTAIGLLGEHPEALKGDTTFDKAKNLFGTAFDGEMQDFEGGAVPGGLARAVVIALGGHGAHVENEPHLDGEKPEVQPHSIAPIEAATPPVQSGEPVGGPAGEGPGSGPAPTPFGPVGSRVTVDHGGKQIGGTIVGAQPVSNPQMGAQDTAVQIKLDDGSIVDQLAGTIQQSGMKITPEVDAAPAGAQGAPEGSAPLQPVEQNSPAGPSPIDGNQENSLAEQAESAPVQASAPDAAEDAAGQAGEQSNPSPTPSAPQSPPSDVADAVHRTLMDGGRYTDIRQLRKEAESVYGGPIKPDSDEAKKVEEDAELGVVMAARDIVRRGDSPQETYHDLVDLYERQPNLIQRNSTSVKNQAYSTPAPLAYIASRLAGVNGDQRVYEPTAGNGMLLIEADPKNVTANELNPDRVTALQRVYGEGDVSEGDALQHKPHGLYDVVISNPPFGRVQEPRPGGGFFDKRFDDHAGFPTTQIDHAIAAKALKHMKPDGRAVLIVGARRGETDRQRQIAYQGESQIRFYRHLFDKYNVTNLFTVDGSLYAKQGAQWPVNVIVIDGKGGNSTAIPPYKQAPKVYSSWDELGDLLGGPVQSSEQSDGAGVGIAEGEAASSNKPEGVSPAAGAEVPAVDGGRGPARSGTATVGTGESGEHQSAGESKPSTDTGGKQSEASDTGSVSSRPNPAESVESGPRDGERTGSRDTGNAERPTDVTKAFADEGKSAGNKLTDLAASGDKEAQGLVDRLTGKGKPEITVLPNTAKTVLVSDPSKRLEQQLREALPKASIDYSNAKEGWIVPSRWMDQLKKSFDVTEDQPHTDAGAEEVRNAQLEAERARAERERAEAERAKAEAERAKAEAERVKKEAAKPTPQPAPQPAAQSDDFDSIFNDALDEQFGRKKPDLKVGDKLAGGTPVSEAAKVAKQVDAAKRDEGLSPDMHVGDHVGTPPRTAGEAAKSAVANVGGGLADSTKALVSIFNDLAKAGQGRASSGVDLFDPQVYEKAKPHFAAALEHFKEAGNDIRDMVRALVAHLANNGLTRDAIEAMKPYVQKFVADVKSGAVKLGQTAKAVASKVARQNTEEETEFQVQYQPKSAVNFAVGTLVPHAMQDAINHALSKLEDRVGDIDAYVAKNLGMTDAQLNDAFSAEQVDALALAMNNVEQGAGFIIGDQTGVGKGRFVAGMLRYALMKGKTPVFITKDAGLYADMIRDLHDIGMKGIENEIFVSNRDLRGSKRIPIGSDKAGNELTLGSLSSDAKHVRALDEIAATGQLPDGYRIYFTTYSQNQFSKGKPSRAMPALEALAPGSMFVLDESHMAGGTAKERQPVDKDGNPIMDRAQFFRKVLQDVPGVVYSSATYAKNPHTMSLYFKTDISLAVDNVEDLPQAMAQGGVPLQQIIANMLVQSGQYVRRERTFAGVEFKMDELPTDKARAEKTIELLRNIFDLDVTIMQGVREAYIEELAADGEIGMGAEDSAVGNRSANGTNFANVMHNIVAQMLLALKTESAAKWAVDEIKAGRKPLIALMNTNDAILGDYIEDAGLTWGDKVTVPFNVIIERYLNRLRRITIKDRDTEEVTYKWIDLDQLEEIAGQEAREEYERVEDLIKGTDLMGLSATPIDTMMDRIRAAGYNVDEITGRQRVVRDGKLEQRHPSNAEKKRVMNGFNAGKLDALVLNNAGSTGYSMHATDKPGNDGKQRSMMIVQPDPDINVFMQMLGRIHRTGQIKLPRYTIATSDLTAEKRVAAILMNKMASLNANTTASAESGTTLKNVVNFMNIYGDRVVANFLRENPEIKTMTDTAPGQDISDLAKKFFGRAAILPTKLADEVYEAIESEYKALIESLDAMGENTLKASTLELDAKTLSKEVFIPSSDDGSDSPFAAPAYVENVDVKKLGRPMKPDEIAAEIKKVLDEEVPDAAEGVRPTRWAEKQQAKLDALMPAYLASKEDDLKKAQEVLAAAKTDKQKERATERVNSWITAIQTAETKLELAKQAMMDYRPGKVFTITYGKDYRVTAVSLGVDLKSVKNNPTAFGSMTVKFAVSDASRRLPIPLSQLITTNTEDGGAEMGDHYEVLPRFGTWQQAMQDFDQGEEVREKRTIMTGNLVASYAKLPQGQIIQFRRNDGQLSDGILMKQGFDLKKELEKLPVKFTNGEQIIRFLEKTRTGLASSFEPKGAVQFAIGNNWNDRDDIILRVGNKNKVFYTAKQITDIVGNFNQQRGKRSQWVAVIPRNRVQDVVDAYNALGVEFGTETFKDEAREVVNPADAQARAQKKAAKSAIRQTVISAGERRAILKRFRKQLDKLGLHDVALKIEQWIDPEPFNAERVDGFYDPVDNLIALAQHGENLQWAFGHEAIHALRAMDLFLPAEWRALAHSITADEMARIRDMYPELNHEGQIEEAIAERFGKWFASRNGERGFWRTAFEKIAKVMNALIEAINPTPYDPTDPDSIFRKIEDGTIGRREGGIMRQGPSEYGPRAKKAPRPNNRPEDHIRKEAADAAEFSNPETEARWQDARRGIHVEQDTYLARAAAWFQHLSEGFTRHWVHLPNMPIFADVQQQLRKLEAAPGNARDDIMRYLKGLTEGFTADDMDLFSRKVVLDDLMFDLDKERDLPFGFTPETLRDEHRNVTEQIAKAGLQDAVNNRRLVVQRIADDMVRYGVLSKDQIENPYYYRHQVLEYARAEVLADKVNRFTGKAKVIRKPFWHGRMGSVKDINANILEAEMDWLYKALVDIQTSKTIAWIKQSPLNIRRQVTADARAHNDSAIADLIQADIDANGYSDGKGGMTSPINEAWKDYQRRIAMGIDGVRRELVAGNITNIPPQLEASARAVMNEETSDEGFFDLFSWIIDNEKPGATSAAAAFNAINQRREFMQTSLGKDFANTRDIESLIAKGFAPEGYVTWQPDPGKLMFTSQAITVHTLNRFIGQVAGENMEVEDAIRQAFKDQAKQILMVGGDKYQLVIPQELAATLDNFTDARTENLINGPLQHMTSAWKKWTLFMPRRAFKYVLNNSSGDIDAIIAGNPGVLSKLKQATREVIDVAHGEQPSEAYMAARDRGVFGSAITAQEIQQISSMDEFKALSRAEDADSLPKKLARSYFRKVMDLNNGRETILRYAAYLDYMEKIEKGIPQERIGYGASDPQMVKAVTDPSDRAALLARDLMGDYGAISYNGAKLRRGLMPFFSWLEINTKRYWRLTANAWNTGRGKGIVTGAALAGSAALRRGLWLALRMAAMWGAIWLWNNTLFHKEEDQLEQAERMQLHVFIPSWDGQAKSIRLQGAFSDAISWFGYGDAMAALDLANKGQLAVNDVTKIFYGAPTNKVWSQITPMVRVPLELYTGKQTWPDVWEPTAIRDSWKHLFQTFSLDHEYEAARNMLAKTGAVSPVATRGYLSSLAESVVYSRDPGEIAYNRIKGLAARFESKRTGDSGNGGGSTTNSRLLYEYRTALRYGDTEHAHELKQELMHARDPIDGRRLNTPEKIRQAEERADPLYSIPKRYRDDFKRSLSDDELQSLHDAKEWYRQTFK